MDNRSQPKWLWRCSFPNDFHKHRTRRQTLKKKGIVWSCSRKKRLHQVQMTTILNKQYWFNGVILSVQSSIYCGGLDGFLLSNPPSVAQNEREGGINASVPTHPAIHTWPSEDAVKKYYHISTFQIDKLRTGKYSMMKVKALFYW